MSYEAVRTVFSSKPCPRAGVVCHLKYYPPQIDTSSAYHDMQPAYWGVILYRDNFDSFSGEDRVVIFNWASDIVSSIRVVEPRCYVEMEEKVPHEQ